MREEIEFIREWRVQLLLLLLLLLLMLLLWLLFISLAFWLSFRLRRRLLGWLFLWRWFLLLDLIELEASWLGFRRGFDGSSIGPINWIVDSSLIIVGFFNVDSCEFFQCIALNFIALDELRVLIEEIIQRTLLSLFSLAFNFGLFRDFLLKLREIWIFKRLIRYRVDF